MPLKLGWLDPVRDLFEEQLTRQEKNEAYKWPEIIRNWPEAVRLGAAAAIEITDGSSPASGSSSTGTAAT